MSSQSSEKKSSRLSGWTKYVDEVYDPIKVGSIDGNESNLFLTVYIFQN